MSDQHESVLSALNPKRALGKCQYLLVGLLIMLIASPIGDQFGTTNYVLYATELFVIVGGLMALGNNRLHTILAIICVIPMVTTSVLAVIDDDVNTLHSGVSSFLFYAYLAFTLRRYLIARDRVTKDSIAGMLVSYMVIALMFASIYAFFELVEPGAIYLDPDRFADAEIKYGEIVYFSFVTQTTLGYGDITPVSKITRALAFLQATLGVFFIAIIVAQFISQYRHADE